jgi:hypothetical protein
MYRDDWDAAVARATAAEQELAKAQRERSQDVNRLGAELHAARMEIERLRSMQQYPAPGYFPPAPYGYAPVFPMQARGTTILVFGVLSLLMCSLFGPVAWSMGSEELRRIDQGQVDPSTRGAAQAGQICGIIATVMLGLVVLIMIPLFAAASHH